MITLLVIGMLTQVSPTHPWVWVVPWVVVPIVLMWRMRDSASLDAYAADPAPNAPRVSIVVPARNEARNIEACVRSILASRYPDFEVIVMDDASQDGTGDIAGHIAAEDGRVRVVTTPELINGWFGKQWACHNGALEADGTLLLFTDADTRHGPELLARAVHALQARGADLLSVAGDQTMESFWERVLQLHVFAFIFGRYGGLEKVSRATNPLDKIGNGQYMLMRSEAYDRAGGHAAVRDHVAEDLRMAQEWCRLGLSVQIVLGMGYMSTRMYEGLGEIVRGWGKNIYAGGRDTINVGSVGQALLRVVYPVPTLWEIVPTVMVVLALSGVVGHAWLLWGATVYGLTTLFWVAAYRWAKAPVWYALLHPVASVVLFYVFAKAAWKGSEVEWKGRRYTSQSPRR